MDKKYIFSYALKYIAYGLMIFGIVAIFGGFFMDPHRMWLSLLLNNYYFLSLAIGASFFFSLQYITQSGWSSGFKRIPEAIASYIPVAAIMMFIAFIGMKEIYPWINPESKGFDSHSIHLIEHKAPYLNIPFFLIRAFIFLSVWIIMTQVLRKLSLREDLSGGTSYFEKSEHYSKVYIFLLAATFSLATFDWIMSVDPTWFSTIFSLKNFVSAFFHGTGLIVLIVVILHHYGFFPFINNAHWHDFSKYIFILGTIWVYFWFAEFLLIWYANIPEETIYFVKRHEYPWNITFYLAPILNWVIPFLALLSNYFAKKKWVLGIVVSCTFVGMWIDLFNQIMPGSIGSFHLGFIEIGTFMGFAGLFLYIMGYTLSRSALIPANHPYLNECVHHH